MKKISFLALAFITIAVTPLFLSGCQTKQYGAGILGGSSQTLPDLVIQSASLKPVGADALEIELTLANTGQAAAQKSFALLGNWIENPSLSTRLEWEDLLSGKSLAPSASFTLRRQVNLPELIGQQGNFKLSLDNCTKSSCINQVAESNENNNDLIIFFSL